MPAEGDSSTGRLTSVRAICAWGGPLVSGKDAVQRGPLLPGEGNLDPGRANC